MRRILFMSSAVATLTAAVAYMAPASGQADGEATPIYGIKIPSGYRDWKVISVAQVAGPPTNVQFMVKDLKKYASTGGWGFAQFTDGKPDGEACTEPALAATSLGRITTLSSPVTRLSTERQRKPPALTKDDHEMSLINRRAVVAAGAALASSAIAQSAPLGE